MSISLRACGSVTPRARRPITCRLRTLRFACWNGGGSSPNGSHMSLLNGNFISGGITPTIVQTRSFTLIARPSAARSAAYRLFQTLSLMMTTGSAPGVSSAAVKSRPSCGR